MANTSAIVLTAHVQKRDENLRVAIPATRVASASDITHVHHSCVELVESLCGRKLCSTFFCFRGVFRADCTTGGGVEFTYACHRDGRQVIEK